MKNRERSQSHSGRNRCASNKRKLISTCFSCSLLGCFAVASQETKTKEQPFQVGIPSCSINQLQQALAGSLACFCYFSAILNLQNSNPAEREELTTRSCHVVTVHSCTTHRAHHNGTTARSAQSTAHTECALSWRCGRLPDSPAPVCTHVCTSARHQSTHLTLTLTSCGPSSYMMCRVKVPDTLKPPLWPAKYVDTSSAL
mmetsp:Transcript_5783/g.13614  ORF Transcript_5783/g.13614 Transcript_5783/m.13614 type:complete len:200 (+) Transcript_5783:603-1202(+)